MKRGNLLWTGSRMMLSEHRQLLSERLREEEAEYDSVKELDEQMLGEWQEIWEEAVANNREVLITFSNNKAQEKVAGRIVSWNQEQGILYLRIRSDERIKILFKQIIDFQLK